MFADDVHTLAEAGYTAATAADIDAALAGHPPVGHKVLITFDDGAKGIWTYADPILAHYRMHAMAFIITGDVGTHRPYYVTWPELQAMHRAGRWDFESHTHLGHGAIPSSPFGGKGPFLATRQWLPSLHRYETLTEYQARVSEDLAASRADMIAHGLPAPHFFAFPFSATGYPANDRRIPPLLRSIIRGQFAAAFENERNAGAISSNELATRLLPRIEITGHTSPLTMLRRLRRVSPLTVEEANLSRETDWCCAAEMPNVTVDQQGALRLLGTKRTGWRLSTYGPGRAASWAAYTFSATAHALTPANSAAALMVRSDGTAAIRVIVTREKARIVLVNDTGGTTELAHRKIRPADAHHARVTVTPAGTSVVVDGFKVAEFGARIGPPSGGIGLGEYLTGGPAMPWFDDVTITPASH
jgi:poly-beta-1,6-N-acetyl-D-glucosamine N-deacetylase